MKTTIEIAVLLFRRARALVQEGLRLVPEARRSAVVQPFRLRDGSFKGGRGLQHGVKWQDLPALAYSNEGASFKG